MMVGKPSSRMQESGKQVYWFVFQTLIQVLLSDELCRVFVRMNSLRDTWCLLLHEL